MTYFPQVIPRCLREMTQSPPLCLHQQKDIQAIQILREHGQESGCSYHSTTQAIDLASGLSDVIVILERPRTEISHSPNQSYADFVNGCHTLKAVDELLRFASRGTRDIGTVTVVNAFSLQPDKNALKADLRCEEILAQFIQMKRPQIIIHCTNTKYGSPWMRRFNFGGDPYRVRSEHIEIDDGHTAIVIPSFHPSHAINYYKHRLELRVLLMYHFALAFHSLRGETVISCCANKIKDLCLVKGKRMDSPTDWELASCISDNISQFYLYRGKDVVPLSKGGFADESLSEQIARESETFDSLSFWLTLLLEKPQKFELFGLASARFLLQKANSNHTPLYSKVSSVLLGVVTEQDHWFLQVNDSNVTDVEEKLSSLTIQDGTQVSGLIDANRKAWGAVQETLCHVESGEVLNFCPKAPRYYYDVVSHYTLMNKYLASSQGIAIPVALRMEALTKRCWVINETLRKKSEDEGELLHTSVILCLNILLECIRKLRMEVEAILE
ncbi:hypothetical protein PCH_Pc12g02270 [Penicillium rubens Wisconsin 54-1255]|uniref:Uncharacterized protein n=2 Tax=Penicillium rubens TaxID=1108849 RepID=B6GZV1_PENRW|nr:hypothetical protein PCH_Pc12g02270 [Penicillium rubens Wisconsin 54-1255]